MLLMSLKLDKHNVNANMFCFLYNTFYFVVSEGYVSMAVYVWKKMCAFLGECVLVYGDVYTKEAVSMCVEGCAYLYGSHVCIYTHGNVCVRGRDRISLWMESSNIGKINRKLIHKFHVISEI